jgi:uncharacterized repeat protein (TIGR03806 family)
MSAAHATPASMRKRLTRALVALSVALSFSIAAAVAAAIASSSRPAAYSTDVAVRPTTPERPDECSAAGSRTAKATTSVAIPGLSDDPAQPLPAQLSRTGLFDSLRPLVPAPQLRAYAINVSFWSDGAEKSRWIALPPGGHIEASAQEPWSFPAGTVFVKHFARADEAATPIETRVLVWMGSGTVRGAAYRWRADGSDADLVEKRSIQAASSAAGASAWFYPAPEDCNACHTCAAGGVLGVNTRQWNGARAAADESGSDEIAAWSRAGLLVGELDATNRTQWPRLHALNDTSAPLEERARSYLDVNCGMCHRPGGAVADFDARSATPLAAQNLVGARARIDFGLDHARIVAPNDPWRSILLVRMQTLEQVKMPPLAHEVPDREGIALVRAWIESLPGPPVVAPPRLTPTGCDRSASVVVDAVDDDASAAIRYTLDGSVPVATSALWTAPLVLDRSATVRVRAWRDGWTPSVVAQETYIIHREENSR